MGEWTKAAKVGLFVIAVGIASVLIFRFVSRTTGVSGGYTVYALFRDAVGLAPQSRVLMAGIPVGTIQSVRLDHELARVDIKMAPDVVLHDDAAVAKRSSGILGEHFLSLSPGSEGRPALRNGDRIPNVLEAASTDQLISDLARIADRVKLVAENLANTVGSPEGREDMRKTLENLAGVTEALNQTVRENRETIRHTLLNFEDITSNSGPEIKRILENVRVLTSDVRDLLSNEKGDEKGSG